MRMQILILGFKGLIKVSFKVNKGNTFGYFGYCPLNRGCPLKTGFTVIKMGDWSEGNFWKE